MREELSSFKNQFERLKKATDANSDTQLAKKLGLRQGSISGAKQKQKIPPAWIVTVSNNFNVNSDWLLTGQGSMLRDEQTTIRSYQRIDISEKDRERYGIPPANLSVEMFKEVTQLREECRLLREENRELNNENRKLLKENGDLRVDLEKAKARGAPEDTEARRKSA